MKKEFNENKMSPPTVNVGTNASFAGHFKLEVHREHGESRGVVAEFPNLILDSGLLGLVNGASSQTEYCFLGTSSAPVSAEQVMLGSLLPGARASDGNRRSGSYVGGSPFLITQTEEYRFDKGVAAGTIAEIGLKYGYENPSSGRPLFCRALVTDAGGLPTTITVAADEFLTVTYTLSCYLDVEDKPFTLNLSSGVHDGILRFSDIPAVTPEVRTSLSSGLGSPNFMRAYYGASELGDIHGRPSKVGEGTSEQLRSQPVTTTPATVAGGPKDSVLEIALTSGNGIYGVSGISALEAGYTLSGASLQMSFDPPIPKTGEHVFRLRIRQTVGRR